jgi:hypothetical protein
MTVKCSALAKSGKQCRRPALAGKALCLMRDPESVELRREAGRRGGRNRSTQVRAEKELHDALSAQELGAALSLAFFRVLNGQLEPKIGTAAATMAGKILDCRDVAERPRIEALEAQAERFRLAIEGKIREGTL